MKKRILALLLCLALCVSLVPAAFAGEIEIVDAELVEENAPGGPVEDREQPAPGPDAEIQLTKLAGGYCGSDATWSLYEGGILYIDGDGATFNYSGESSTDHPDFYTYRSEITQATVLGGVTKLGTYLFSV